MTDNTISRLKNNLQQVAEFLEAIHSTAAWVTTTASALEGMLTIGKQAQGLAQSGVTTTMGVSERQALAVRLDSLLQQAIEVGNTSLGDHYIFAGCQLTITPFVLVDRDGMTEAVSYKGDEGDIRQQIGPGQAITKNIVGASTFMALFKAMILARDALNTNNIPELQTAVRALGIVIEDMTKASTLNNDRLRQVHLVQERMENSQLDLRGLLSQDEDLSTADAISTLRRQETVYQAALEVGQRAISAVSLFDMLS